MEFITLFGGALINVASNSMSFWQTIQAPEDISVNGHLIHWLFNYITYANLFFFGLVCAGLFGFSYFYSAKRNLKATYDHGTSKKQKYIVLGLALSVFFGVDFYITGVASKDYTKVFSNFPTGKDVLRVEVLAQQWMWNFRYPGKDGVFNTEDDITTNNDLRLPIGKKVVFQMTSKDVIHSFYVPNTLRKVDVIPGRITRMWFELKKTGLFDIACAEMCGTHHYLMKAKLTVYSEEDYESWLEQAGPIAIAKNTPDNPDNFWGWIWQK